MDKKPTKADNFRRLLTFSQVSEDEQSVEFINHELKLLQKKADTKSKKQTKAQEENERIKDDILDVLQAQDAPLTTTELMKSDDKLSAYSTQKLAPLLTSLVKDGKIERIEEKGKALFQIA